MTFLRSAVAAIALFAAIGVAPARAACWSDTERDAVSVRELQTMLMVTSLRCRAAGIDILADYNGFVTAQRDAIEAANRGIKAHFAFTGGNQADYDRFTTLLANSYGAGQTDAATCAEAADTAREAVASAAALHRLAANRIFPRALPNDDCAPPRQVRAPVIAAAPPADAARDTPGRMVVVSLPDDVTAALAVMARYGRTTAPAAAAAPAAMLPVTPVVTPVVTAAVAPVITLAAATPTRLPPVRTLP